MGRIASELDSIARRCRAAAASVLTPELKERKQRLLDVIETVEESWSGSWIGYHARVYLEDLRPRGPDDYFDSEWGLEEAFGTRTWGPWREYPRDAVRAEVLERAHLGEDDIKEMALAGERAGVEFERCKNKLLALLDGLIDTTNGKSLPRLREEVEAARSHESAREIAMLGAPKSSFVSRDRRAMLERTIEAPVHRVLRGYLLEVVTYSTHLNELAELAQRTADYVRMRAEFDEAEKEDDMSDDKKVFVVHGRNSAATEAMYAFLRALGLSPIEWC